MAVPPGTWSWLPPPTKKEVANYVPFDVTFEILVNGKQVIKPTAIGDRLNQLDALFKQEIISKQEYEQQRKKILKDL